MTHIMLDIETWGKIPGSDIRSIGAVVFDPAAQYGGWVGVDGSQTFYTATDNPKGRWRNGEFVLELAKNENERLYPLTRDPETVQWWSEQSAEAQAAFANPIDLRDALQQFGEWLGRVNDGEATNLSDGPLRIWANDPHFDCSILAAAYRAVDLSEPWHYRSPRSQKTITDAAGMTRDDFAPFNHGTAHNALDDAISQARIVCEAYRRLGLQRS